MPFKKILKAAYEYEATAEDELNFHEGDMLGIIGDEEGEDGWYYGCNVLAEPETNGFIPTTYCEELKVIEEVRAGYEYSAQEENELCFGEGQILQLLHRIDDDWWLAKDESSGECGMVPANYFGQGEPAEQDGYEAEPAAEIYEEPSDYDSDDKYEEQEEEVKYYAPPPPPPPPMPSFDEPEEKQYDEEQQEEHQYKEDPVDELSNSQFLKQKCDALFLDSKYAKTKGQLIFEKALYLCTIDSIEHCYDLSELRDYDSSELKLTLNSGEKVAIGLGKKDAKKFSELVKEISGYEEPEKKEKEQQEEEAPPLPKAPVVVGPKIPEDYHKDSKKSETSKTPMIVGVSFEGFEGEEVSIFEGEEVYLLSSDGDDGIAGSQFARIEKVNGVQGLVPKNFLMSRSEYQKKKEKDAEIEHETRKQMAELSMASEAKNTKSKPSTFTAPSSNTDAMKADNSSIARSESKKSSSPWSALASGSTTVALPKQQQKQSSSVKLENSRLWKDKSGKFQVEAEFVSLIDGKVTILKTSGSEATVPLEILSERDIEYSCKRAGIPYTKKSTNTTNGGTMVKGFDWLAFFLSIGIEAGKAREYGEKFANQSFEESMISAFTSDFLTAQGMQMTEIYKILPEAAKRKAQAMQANAKEKHRNNNSQVVLSSGAPEVKKKPTTTTATASTLVPFKAEEKELVIHEDSPKIQMFPTIEELESQGAIELGKGNSQVALPGGISVSKSSNDDSSRVIVQPIESADVKERRREVVGADGSMAKEYTRVSTSTSIAPVDPMGSSSIALMQQQMQTNAMMQAQAQAHAHAQMQMRMQAQAQAQAQMQMQMRAQAAAQAQAQAQAQFQQQQRMYQMQQQQQQQSAPSVHITIHTGDKGINQNPMTPPMPLMNQPMMQMNNAGMMGGMMAPSPMNPIAGTMMANPMNPMAMNPMNPMNPMGSMNPFDPTNPYNNNGFGF